MNKGWLELESDPGLFTLLLQDIGVKGVQVEEIYDLQKPIEGPTYGFIFLFRWIEERRSRRKTITEEETFVTDENIVNSIFFAQQVIPNSCATHALLSVLLNCEKVNLGETLSKLKAYCRNMSPETKGDAIGNIPELAKAHNSHARKEPSHLPEKQQGMTVRTMEAFHFVSYVPINGRLFELDGLKPWPIDHGPWDSNEDWTEKFRRVISERLGMATGGEPYHDIRYNLMAVVPDKVSLYEHKLSTLKTNRQIVLDAIQQMMKGTYPASTEKEKSSPNVEKNETVQQPHKYPLETSRQSIGPQSFNTSSSKGVETVMSVRSDNTRSDIKEETPMDVDFISVSSAADQKRVEIKTDNSLEIKTDILHVKEEVVVTQQAAYPDTPAESSKDTEITTQLNLNKANTETDSIKPSQNNPVVSESSDVTKPLTIETKFATSPGPSSESTDTASEVGSAFSSPGSAFDTSAQNSPNLSSGEKSSEHSPLNRSDLEGSRSKTKFSSQQGFRFKDLVALLNNVDNEIKLCETKLQDEQEKIRKYKIDDCRRTHNYDPFLCTFLSMLAEQGLLAELIQQHSLIKKRVPGRIGKLAKLTQAKKRTKAKRRR